MGRLNAVVVVESILFGFVWGTWAASMALGITGYTATSNALMGIVGGAGLYLVSKRFAAMLRWRKANALVGLLPEDIDVNHNDDGTQTLFVTRRNGDVTTLLTPEGYHPSQDNAAWLLDNLLPEEARHLVDSYAPPMREEE